MNRIGRVAKNIDKFRGCLIGGAIGDALGYPVEFLSLDQIKNKYGPEGITSYNLKNGKALISDDTQMTLYTANALLYAYTQQRMNGNAEKPEFYIWRAYKDWYKAQIRAENPERIAWLTKVPELSEKRAPGLTCMSALRDCEMGQIRKSINSSKGNGGLMRVAPIGLYYEDVNCVNDVFDVHNNAYNLGAAAAAITHGHPLGYIPAYSFVYIIHNLAYTDASLEDVINDSIDYAEYRFKHYDEVLGFRKIMDDACKFAKNGMDNIENIGQLGSGNVAEEALAIAVYCCLKYKNDFRKAIIAAVNHSGDSDSTGSVAGNILGVYHGYNHLPDGYIGNLEVKDVILEIADDLFYGYKEDENWACKYR